MKFFPRVLGILLLTITCNSTLHAGESDVEKRERAERLEVMLERWQSCRASLVRNDQETAIAPVAQPLLRWTDPARSDSTLR